MEGIISTIILAGGQGSRFNHTDKGLIQWQGKTLVEHVIERLEPQSQQIIINCNRNLTSYQTMGFPTCQDEISGYQGPLAGVHAALPLATHPLLFISPCDTPRLPENLLNILQNGLHIHAVDAVYPSCQGQNHYLPMLIKTELGESLRQYLDSGQRSVKGWLNSINSIAIPFDDNPTAFININRPQDLIKQTV